MDPRIPDSLLEMLAHAPRNCRLALDLAQMQVLECSRDLLAAVQKMKEKNLINCSPDLESRQRIPHPRAVRSVPRCQPARRPLAPRLVSKA